MLPRHTRYVLSRLGCNGHSLLLGSYLSRIGKIENPSCSACRESSQETSDLILHYPATDSLHRLLFGDSLCLSGPALESCPASGAPWFSAMLPSIGRGRLTNNNNNTPASNNNSNKAGEIMKEIGAKIPCSLPIS